MKRFVYILVATTFTSTQTFSQIPKAAIKKFDSVYTSYKKTNYWMSNAVAVIDKQGTLYTNTSGFASIELGVPLTPRHKIRLASVSKHFCVVLALKLAESGIVDIFKPIAEYIPVFKGKPIGNVTLYQIFSNTSGIPANEFIWEYATFRNNIPLSGQSLLDSLSSVSLEFEPGTKWAYSNTGYVTASVILEMITKKRFADLLQEYIFIPLHMNDSGVDDYYSLSFNKSNNYIINNDNDLVPARPFNLSTVAAAGGMISTLEDMCKWAKALFLSDSFLSKKSKELMFKPNKGKYAMGIINTLYKIPSEGKEIPYIWHDGQLNGTRTLIAYLPEKQVCIVSLNNLGEAMPTAFSFNPDKIMHDFFRVIYKLPVQPLKNNLAIEMQTAYRKDGLSAALNKYNELSKDSAHYSISEDQFYGYAKIFMNLKKFQEAIAFFKMALEKFPSSTDILRQLAVSYEMSGNKKEAIECYKKVILINSKDEEASKKLKLLESGN